MASVAFVSRDPDPAPTFLSGFEASTAGTVGGHESVVCDKRIFRRMRCSTLPDISRILPLFSSSADRECGIDRIFVSSPDITGDGDRRDTFPPGSKHSQSVSPRETFRQIGSDYYRGTLNHLQFAMDCSNISPITEQSASLS